jgi:hypothetical protein
LGVRNEPFNLRMANIVCIEPDLTIEIARTDGIVVNNVKLAVKIQMTYPQAALNPAHQLAHG